VTETIGDRLGAYRGDEIGAIGGANNTNEEAFALGKFMRSVVGSAHVDAQLGDGVNPHMVSALTPRATISDLDDAATILVWGPDLKETFPVLYLRVRKAALNGASLVVASPAGTGLDGIATHVVRYRAGSGSETLRKLAAGDPELADVADVLNTGPVVGLVGRSSIAEDPLLAEAAASYARALPEAKLLTLVKRGNVFGALDMGLAPTLLPGRVSTSDSDGAAVVEDAWGMLPDHTGRSTMEMLEAATSGEIKVLLLVGADPVADCPDPALAEAALEQAEFVVAVDAFETASSRRADIILPAAVWGEVDGSVTNLEGRVQRIRRSLDPSGQARSLNGILNDIAHSMGVDLGVSVVANISKEINTIAPAYAGVTLDFLEFEAGSEGAVVPVEPAEQPLGFIPVDVSVPVVTDKMTLHAGAVLYDDGVWNRHAPSIQNLAKRASARLHPKDASALAVDDGDFVLIAGQFELPVEIAPAVAVGSVAVPFGVSETKGLAATVSVKVEPVRGTQ
ncbi:MAG: molybdopterin oxidoreductase family protein, partial [Acidimicrobiia bacterium]